MFSPDGLNNTLSSQCLVLEVAHTFQGQERGEEPLIAWVQILGQPTVMSSRWPLPTLPQLHPLKKPFLPTDTRCHHFHLSGTCTSMGLFLRTLFCSMIQSAYFYSITTVLCGIYSFLFFFSMCPMVSISDRVKSPDPILLFQNWCYLWICMLLYKFWNTCHTPQKLLLKFKLEFLCIYNLIWGELIF